VYILNTTPDGSRVTTGMMTGRSLSVIQVESLNSFNSRLDGFWSNQDRLLFRTYKKRLEIIYFAVNRFLMKIGYFDLTFRNHCGMSSILELIQKKKKIKFERNYNRCILVLRDMCVRPSYS